MSAERLEERLALLIDAAAHAARPPEPAAIRRRRRRRRAARGAVALALALAAAVSVPVALDRAANPVAAPSGPAETVSVAGWAVFRNQEQGWQLRYPREWLVGQFADEEDPAVTLVQPPGERAAGSNAQFAVEVAVQPATTARLAPVMEWGQWWTPPADTATWSRWRRADGRLVLRGVIDHRLTPEEVRGGWADRADVSLAVSPGVTPQQRRRLETELRGLDGVRQVWYQSPADNRRQFIKDNPGEAPPSLDTKIEPWLGYFYLRLDSRGRIAELRRRYCPDRPCPERPIRAVIDFKAGQAQDLPAPAIYHQLAWRGGTLLRGKVSVSNGSLMIEDRTIHRPRDAGPKWARYRRTGEAILATLAPLGAPLQDTVEIPATP